ncbi:MAG: hypothetical protein HFG20_04735 [Anaerotruncus sp.]|nr:hypothetical protein [Anaerotruncus sp.]
MAQIRRKTIDPAARKYLTFAREHGIGLSWNYYERMLPQDGFGRMGLTCSTCAMGPCRLNPFARTEEKTVCGFTTADLVYHRLMDWMEKPSYYTENHIESLLNAAREACAEKHKEGWDGTTSVGMGVLDPERINICAEGVSIEALDELTEYAALHREVAENAGARGFKIALVGEICSRRDTVAAQGDIEFAMLTGLVDAYLIGNRTPNLGKNVAAHYHTAVMGTNLKPDEILQRAAQAFQKRDPKKVRPDSASAIIRVRSWAQIIRKTALYDKVVLIGGGSNVKQTVDEILKNMVEKFADAGIGCMVFGNAAAALVKYDLIGEHVYCGSGYLSEALVYQEQLKDKVAAIFIPELSCGDDIARALTLGDAGFPVMTATELPVEGNHALADEIHKRILCGTKEDFDRKVHEIIGY